jgi:hypothetical protein
VETKRCIAILALSGALLASGCSGPSAKTSAGPTSETSTTAPASPIPNPLPTGPVRVIGPDATGLFAASTHQPPGHVQPDGRLTVRVMSATILPADAQHNGPQLSLTVSIRNDGTTPIPDLYGAEVYATCHGSKATGLTARTNDWGIGPTDFAEYTPLQPGTVVTGQQGGLAFDQSCPDFLLFWARFDSDAHFGAWRLDFHHPPSTRPPLTGPQAPQSCPTGVGCG